MAQYFLRLLKEAPFLRLLLPFVAGIFLSQKITLPVNASVTAMFLVLPVILVYNNIKGVSRYYVRSFAGLLLFTQIFLLGSVLYSLHDIRQNKNWFGSRLSEAEQILICVEEPPIARDKTFKANAAVRAIYTRGKMQAATGKFILYFPRGDSTLSIRYGSMLLVPPTFLPVTNSGNPGAFDYAAYCRLQNIYHQTFLRSNEYSVLTETDKRSFRHFLFASQAKIVEILERFIGGKEAGLAEALLIGYKNNLDKSVLQQYSETGIIHVVAISGMHLGLIYWLLSLLLSTVKHNRTRWLRALLILAGLWLFTLLAGASASVVRSAVMFSLLLIAELADRRSSSINTLASSAFLLLAFNPFWLWDLGFQLSYAALGSILVFMKPVYALLFVQNKGLDMIWKMCATCIAAQVLTTPMVLLLAGRFPVFFLVTNLFAIPLSSLIVLGEVAVCTLSLLTPAAEVLGSVLAALISFMNLVVFRMNRIPFGNLTGLYQEIATVSCLYAVIISASCAIRFKSSGCLVMAGILLNCYAGAQLYYYHKASRQHLLIVYNTPGATIVELVNGRSSDRVVWLQNEAMKNETDQVIAGAHHALRINRRQKIFPDKGNSAFFRRKKIVVLRESDLQNVSGSDLQKVTEADSQNATRSDLSNPTRSDLQNATEADFLVLSNISSGAANKVFNSSSNSAIIIDSSVPRSKAMKWETACKAMGKTCYNVTSGGAFIVSLN